MKIKIKLYEGGYVPIRTQKGDWFDIPMPKDGKIEAPFANILTKNRTVRNVQINNQLTELGFAIELPKGYEAYLLPRSSTYKNFHVDLANTMPVIDNSYHGDDDQWKANIKAYDKAEWKAGDCLFQMRIQLCQYATTWQKIKWLFWNGNIQFVVVDHLNKSNRGTSMNNTSTNK